MESTQQIVPGAPAIAMKTHAFSTPHVALNTWIRTRSLRELSMIEARAEGRKFQDIAEEYDVRFPRVIQIIATLKASLGKLLKDELDQLGEDLCIGYEQEKLNDSIIERFGQTPINFLIESILLKKGGFSTFEGQLILREAKSLSRNYKSILREISDDVGLISLASLEARFSHDHIESIKILIGLHQRGEYLYRRLTEQLLIKWALLDHGGPMTQEEILEKLDGEVPPEKFSLIVLRVKSIIRTDPTHFDIESPGLTRYIGAFNELVEYLKSRGGEGDMTKILQVFPRRFGIKEKSMRQYLRRRDLFECNGNRVKLIDKPNPIRLRTLDKVIHGRNEKQEPYWLREFRMRYLEGVSMASVPNEIMDLMDCMPGQRKQIVPISPEGSPPLSIVWSYGTSTKGSIGGVGKVLRHMGITEENPPANIRFTFGREGVSVDTC